MIKNFVKNLWFDILLIVAASVCLILSSPGYDMWFFAVLAFTLLLWVFERGGIKAWKASFICGFVFITFSIRWIYIPVTTFGGAPGIAGIILVFFTGLVAGLIFWLPFGYVYDKTKSPVLSALVLIALEMFKNKHFFGGTPWLNIAQSQHNNLIALQTVSLVGEQGLSLIIAILGMSIFLILKYRNKAYFIAFVALLGFVTAYGSFKLNKGVPQSSPQVARMVQTGINQADKWNPDKFDEIRNALYERVKEAGQDGGYSLFILPETSFTVNPFADERTSALLYDISKYSDVILSFDKLVRGESVQIYNSIVLIRDGQIAGSYDKMKLAPFGEYFPFEKQLFPIRKFFFGDEPLFTPGTKPVVLNSGNSKIAIMVCFEAIFSELINERIKDGANVIITVSNDSWFGDSIGRQQNFAISKLRAVEYGRYLLRTTQDGISGVVDPLGHKLVVFPEKRYYFSNVSYDLIEKQTVFSKYGYSWYVLVLMVSAVYILKKRRSSKA